MRIIAQFVPIHEYKWIILCFLIQYQPMQKYFTIMKTEWQRQLVHRFNIMSYRIGATFELGTQLIIWTTVFQHQTMIGGYNYKEMMTYVLIGWFFMFCTSNFGFEQQIARQIHLGEISSFLLKPISYIRYTITISIGRNVMALTSSILIQIVFILLFHNSLLPPASSLSFFILVPMLLLGYFINLFLSMLIGLCAFWTHNVDGLFFTFRVLNRFLSGAYFPISVLSASLIAVFSYFPFIYTLFVPVQLYLGKITLVQGVHALLVQLGWVVALFILIQLVWRVGIKNKYEGIGM